MPSCPIVWSLEGVWCSWAQLVGSVWCNFCCWLWGLLASICMLSWWEAGVWLIFPVGQRELIHQLWCLVAGTMWVLFWLSFGLGGLWCVSAKLAWGCWHSFTWSIQLHPGWVYHCPAYLCFYSYWTWTCRILMWHWPGFGRHRGVCRIFVSIKVQQCCQFFRLVWMNWESPNQAVAFYNDSILCGN